MKTRSVPWGDFQWGFSIILTQLRKRYGALWVWMPAHDQAVWLLNSSKHQGASTDFIGWATQQEFMTKARWIDSVIPYPNYQKGDWSASWILTPLPKTRQVFCTKTYSHKIYNQAVEQNLDYFVPTFQRITVAARQCHVQPCSSLA